MSATKKRVEYRQNSQCALYPVPATEVHEITRGANRHLGVVDRRAWIAVCRHAHDTIQNWPMEWQYALKMIRDPEYYDRVWLNETRGRAPDAVSERDVAEVVVNVMYELKW